MATEQSMMAVIRASRPVFRSLYDKAVFAVHAAFAAAGYVLHATGRRAFADDALYVSEEEVGMNGWNDLVDNYAFVYSNPEKGSKKVLVKCLVMNGRLFLDVLKKGESEPLHLELDPAEYVDAYEGSNYGSQFKNLGRLAEKVNKEILDKLDGASAATNSSNRPSSPETSLRDVISLDDPDDPYISQHPGYNFPPIPGSGHSDLFPGPGAGVYPSRGNFGDGGMLVGPDNPLFFGGGPREPGFPGGLPGVPPGARFDPYGPPGVPGFEPGRFVRRPGGRGRGMHPDLEHFHDGSDFI